MKFKLKYIVFAVMLCLPLTTVPVNAVADITLNTISSDFSDLSQTDKLKILKARCKIMGRNRHNHRYRIGGFSKSSRHANDEVYRITGWYHRNRNSCRETDGR